MIIVSDNGKADSLAVLSANPSESVFIEADDDAALRRLRRECETYDPAAHDGCQLECYLLLQDAASLWIIQTMGLATELAQKVDLMVSTPEDLMAKTLLVRLPGKVTPFPPLDRQPIDRQSPSTVHLVIFGSTAMAEALAINAALVAHYPNYCRDTHLRTRITIIDENIDRLRERMTQRYGHLFEHSYLRTLDLDVAEPHCALRHPWYEGRRKDFVDVEWEFVKASAGNEAVRQKLAEWACGSRQLTVAVCGDSASGNIATALTLPEPLSTQGIPVLCHTRQRSLLELAAQGSVLPFSVADCSIDTLRILKEMAMRVNYVYNHCFSLPPEAPVTAPANVDVAEMRRQWAALGSFSKRNSNVFNAMTLGTKMHSAGITPDDWKAYYALSREQIESLAEVEHNRWSVEELIQGYRPVTDDEQASVERDLSLKRQLRDHKIHYDLRAFDDLRVDSTGKVVNVYDLALTQGIPLIIKTCISD